ncbi:hypothetical protein [Sediminicoccus rosea]|uniref:Uncharacterized protein n=1 Tax=Sediminicoccus rosea TaxID=1225128 RepID=A0ABZ0PJB1_9PROT|nr:hypothetical protein [Sediminicoccus rosea]WPB85800.1 hypothetical protein R9Z33_02750 [Sediminicoccus rosea]
MPDAGLSLSPDAMRSRALETLASLVGGTFWEKMRIEAAARIIVTARRVALLAEEGLLAGQTPAGVIHPTAARWDAAAMTANEFAETLETAEIVAILEEAPGWSEAVWAQQTQLSEPEKARLLQRV